MSPTALSGELIELIRRMPKVELHVHLEGSIQPRTLLRLAARHGIELPAADEAGIREWFQYRDFEHFVEIYLTCSSCLREPEDFQLVVGDFLREQARQNILYSEVHFTISTHLANGADGAEVGRALREAVEAGRERWGVDLALIPDIVRNVGPKAADLTLEWALDHRDGLVVALGLSGFESVANDAFREHFRTAREEGLRLVAHAGETAGPESVWSALDDCGAERIGHGVAAIDDPALLRRLADEEIPLEVCPTSNVCLGVVPEVAAHPFHRLWKGGLKVTVNSDDPPFFNTDLTGEYELLAATFDYGEEQVVELSRAALRHAFLSATRRAELEREFDLRHAALTGSSIKAYNRP